MITATVLTKNAEKSLKKTLDSLQDFPEVIVLDSGSSDATLYIAKAYPNVSVHTTPFLGFGQMHNYATKLSSNDWILSIDSDEVLRKELVHEILNLDLNPNHIYSILRENYFKEKQNAVAAGIPIGFCVSSIEERPNSAMILCMKKSSQTACKSPGLKPLSCIPPTRK